MVGLFALSSLILAPDTEPVLWMRPDATITVQGRAILPTVSPGAKKVPALGGWGYDFDGRRAGLLLPDMPALALTSSMTVSVWIRPRSYVNDGPGAQILFRGDDRCGLDPYSLVILGNGVVVFGVQNDREQGWSVGAELPLNTWTHVTASYEDSPAFGAKKLRMWLNGELMTHATTSRTPFSILDKAWAPGVGIGNVQNEKGPHNQPFNGTLFDLRLYQGVFGPGDAGYRPSGRQDPPL